MNNTSPLSDRAKIGLLVVGCVCVALVIGYELTTSGSKQSTVVRTEVAKPVATPMSMAGLEPGVIAVPVYSENLPTDPFRTIFAQTAIRQDIPTRTSQPTLTPPMQSEIAVGGPIQPFLPKIDGIPGATGSLQDLGLRVEGVIAGRGGVAVVKFGPDTMVVRPGERFGDDMVVRSITTTHVVIGKGKQSLKVPVEGTIEPKAP